MRMPSALRYGHLKYLSFLLLDLACIILSSYLAYSIYLELSHRRFNYSVVSIMIVIDIIVTLVFNTLSLALRWRKRRELFESARHTLICLFILGLYLFLTKTSADYSRVAVITSYGIYFGLIVLFRTAWRYILAKCRRKPEKPSVLLMTTDRFVDEGIKSLQGLNYHVQYLYFLEKNDKTEINGIPVVQDVKEAASVICWKEIDKIYIYGLNHQMVPEYLSNACKEMKINLDLVDFHYRVIDVTMKQYEDPKFGSLFFLEGKRDVPFQIRRVYWITETQAALHRGFHAHKLNCQLLYCPYGVIDILLDDGEQKTTVTLDKPGKGLLIMPGLWREMVWKQSGSILCVLASEYYDAQEYIRNYDEFIAYSKKYRESAEA